MSITDDLRPPKLLLVHDGELDDIRDLLLSLGAEFVERRGGLIPEDGKTVWDLVVASSRRGVHIDFSHQQSPPALIGVLEHDSRTLRNSLNRVGIRTLVRRPVHPSALRALLVHALYRGPEKRSSPRVPVGAEVQIRTGWRWQRAILADLSRGGCRLFTETPVGRGKSLRLALPSEITGQKRPFSLKARVLEQGAPSGEAGCEHSVTARFEAMADRQMLRLISTVKHFAAGPARYDVETDSEPEPETANGNARSNGSVPPTPGQAAALGAEASRVLVGREPSLASMRVDPNPDLAVGMELHLVAHLAEEDGPVKLRARVERDDGPKGLLLRFDPVDAAMRDSLRSMLDDLLNVGSRDECEEAGGEPAGRPVLVTEILATG